MMKWLIAGLIALIAFFHIAMWRSGIPLSVKISITTINVIGWTAVFITMFLAFRAPDEPTRKRNEQ